MVYNNSNNNNNISNNNYDKPFAFVMTMNGKASINVLILVLGINQPCHLDQTMWAPEDVNVRAVNNKYMRI